MSRRTKQWRKVAIQARQNKKDGNVGHLIPDHRSVSRHEGNVRTVCEPAKPEKRELMERVMTTPWSKSR